MKEETIETTFRSSDWFASICDTCCQTDKWVVLLADERACNTCLEEFYDEAGDKTVTDDDLVFGNSYQQAVGLLVVLSMIPLGILIGTLILGVL
jgi:hypothetical protein